MPNGYVFPYGISLREGGFVDTFPVAEVSFPSKEGDRISLFLLIDSGAAISALPAADAKTLGIDAVNGDVMHIAGIDGRAVKAWRHEIKVGFGKESFDLPLAFLENSDAPRVLGREGVFDKFTLIFEESKSRIGLVMPKTKESLAISQTLDKLK